MDTPTDPVITVCGHLYCWPCLYKWAAMTADCPKCPVCNAGIVLDKVIPLYGRGNKREDQRAAPEPTEPSDMPDRPAGQRPAAVQYAPARQPYVIRGTGAQAVTQIGGVSFTTGFGLFPSLVALTFGHSSPLGASDDNSDGISDEHASHPALSRMLLAIGVGVIVCIVMF